MRAGKDDDGGVPGGLSKVIKILPAEMRIILSDRRVPRGGRAIGDGGEIFRSVGVGFLYI